MPRSRIFWQLVGTYGLLVIASAGLVGSWILFHVERDYLQQVEDNLRNRAILIRELVGEEPLAAPALQRQICRVAREIATRVTLLAGDGAVLADSEEDPAHMENHASRPEVREALSAGTGTSSRFSQTLNQSMMYLALRIDNPRPLAPALVRVSLPLTVVEGRLAELRRLVWTSALAIGAGGMALAFWLARRIALPLRELTAGAERIAAGTYGHKVYAVGRGEIGTLAATFNNMSERLRTQFMQLQEDRQQLRTILSGMVEGVIALDVDQRIVFANQCAADLLDFQPAAMAGRKLWEVVRHRPLQEAVRRAWERPEPYREELSWNGTASKCLTVHAARLPGTPPRGIVLVLHDTSELRRLERMRQEFVANVSHELKTPLSVIKACVETLIEGAVDDREHRGRFLEQIAGQSDRLQALILDLISLGRIESGREALEFRAISLQTLVASCLERHRARATGMNQTLETTGPIIDGNGTGDVATWGDEEAISQIMDNLVDNALKYTPAGGTIRVRWGNDGAEALLEVQDTGIGIPERDLPRIFERFYRVDKARSREMGGTGLGLSIVKHLVQEMEGSVRAISRPGEGTTFSVRLPLPPASRP